MLRTHKTTQSFVSLAYVTVVGANVKKTEAVMKEECSSGGRTCRPDCHDARPDCAERVASRLTTREIWASHSGGITVREAGRKGGLSCLRNKGRGFFVKIGKKGQFEMRQKYPDMAGKWGKMGGRPKRLTLWEIMGDAKE